jgi:PAS domain S-box-containing protein
METKVEKAANEIKRPQSLYQQSDQRSGASRHLEWRPEAVMAEQNRDKKIAMSDASARPVFGGLSGYALSVLLVALSTSVTLLLRDYTFRTPLFLPAILLSTWFGGTGPGVLAVLLSTLSINFFLLEPRFAFGFSFRDFVHLAVFLFTALLISSWSAGRRRAESALKRARDDLEKKVEERTADLILSNEQLRLEIAERTRSASGLREKASLLNLTHDTVFVRDMNDVITYWNRGAEERYGWSSEEAVGRVSHQLTQTSLPKPLPEIQAELLETGQWEGELVHTRRDGTSVMVASRWALQRDEANKPVAILETNNDITERKQAEENLRHSEAFLAEGQRISHTGSWSWNVSNGNVAWSEEHFRIFGFDPEKTKPSFQLFSETIHPEDRLFIKRSLDEAIKEKRGFDIEFRIALADGSVKHVQGVGRPVLGESGEVHRYIGTTVDITGRKRGEALFAGEKRLLEMIATGIALKEILNALCQIIEEYRPATLASILLLRPDGFHLDSVAGPSLPKGWRHEMEKLPIGPCAGSCGTAAYRGSPVIVSDIASDPLWEVPEHRAAALSHGLRASWSNPILSSEGKVLGTFCIYSREMRSPSAHDLGVMEKATHLARVAIERDRAEAAVRTSEEKYRDLINASPDAICVVDADGKCVLVNPAGVKLAGRPEHELIGSSLAETYLPEERRLFRDRIDKLKAEGSFRFERKFLRPNGEVIPVEVSLSALRGRHYQAIIRDVSQRKRREGLLAGENRVLEMVAKGDSLSDILEILCLLVEEQSSGVLASILLVDANGKQLRHGAAPNLPKAYTEAVDGAFIGPAVGSCGTAAYRAEQVVVSDIATDPLWDPFRDLALAHSLRACWSTPIFSSEGKVIGTFAMYYREPRSPSPLEQDTIKHITHLAGVAIQRKLAEMARRESEAYLAEAQRLSHTGSWAWTPATGETRYWSEETYRVLGFDPGAGPPRFEKFFGRLYPEDQDRVRELFGIAIAEKAEFETDYRVVHPSGAIKHIHAVGHPICDEAGHFVEFLGTVIDVTESKRAEEALRASEQVARGQVEALAQSLDVLATAPDPEKFIGQMLSTIGRLLNAHTVSLWLFDDSGDSLILRSSTSDGGKLAAPDPEHPFIKNPLFWKENAVVQELLFTAGPVVCDDVETDPRVSGDWGEHLKRNGTKRFLVVPLLVGGQVKGFVGIRHVNRASYRPEEIELTQALSHQVMLALQLNEFAEQGQRAAVLEERNRMARDIHDTLAQGFTGVIVQLEAAEDAVSCGYRKEADDHLHRAGQLARQSLSDSRRSVHALRPRALEEHNFWDALKGSIKNTTVGTALHATFEAQGKLPELPQPWQENLLHIGQEALTNTLKYAHARNFKTRLTYKAKELRLELRDDGDGFKVKDRHDGLGLRGMRERVEQMGGELEITSSGGKGTKISVLLPCNGEAIP